MWSKDILDMKFNDCQSAYLDRETHLSLMKNASIVISTNGFGNSLPWKLAEYCKLGKCIVSEELTHELPNPLIKGVHLEIYNDDILTNIHQCLENNITILEAYAATGSYFNNIETLITSSFLGKNDITNMNDLFGTLWEERYRENMLDSQEVLNNLFISNNICF